LGSEHAEVWQKFYTAYFNPYLNYHRPCGFATVATDRRGKRKRCYRVDDYRTPYEKLMLLKKWKQYLKPGIKADLLARQSKERSDTEVALHMQKAGWNCWPNAVCRSDPRDHPPVGRPRASAGGPVENQSQEGLVFGSVVRLPLFQAHLVLEPSSDFRLFLRLENALDREINR
jgi:hypothetical protein